MKRHQGFTILELIVAMVIGAVLLGIAAPELSRLGISAARAKGASELYAALNEARAEAIARNGNVTLCRRDWYTSADFPQCAIGTDGTWTQGWIVFQDSTGLFASTEPDAAEDIVSVYDRIGNTTVSGTNNAFDVITTLSPATHITFRGNGRPTSAFSFVVCDNSEKLSDARRISVSLSGSISLRKIGASEAATACA